MLIASRNPAKYLKKLDESPVTKPETMGKMETMEHGDQSAHNH